MSTPHNAANKGEIAKTVLMPGDPLRAKFVADTFLKDVKQFNNVRGMLGFTGTYKGKEVSVMGSGMGMPSIGIYSYELYNFYDVDNIIRIGSAGAMIPELDLFNIVLATAAYSESTYARCAFGYEENIQKPTDAVCDKIREKAADLNLKLTEGTIFSSDTFYFGTTANQAPYPEKLLCAEMESFALFANARYSKKNAACLLTISDSIVTQKETTAEQRQTAFLEMMELALDAAIEL